MKRLLIMLLPIALAFSAYACFDTFLFMSKRSMVYPKKTLAVEAFGEYSYNSLDAPGKDAFFADGRLFYGVSDRLSVQFGIGSDEKPRGQFGIDAISASGTYNILSRRDNNYTIDGILACVGNTKTDNVRFEVSAPNIFRVGKFTIVAHPVVEILKDDKFDAAAGAHFGLFRVFDDRAVFGVGAEYQSGQSGPYFGDRLVEGEAATSLFFGAMISKNLFIQNELAKGLANSRDIGYAVTIKGVFDFDR